MEYIEQKREIPPTWKEAIISIIHKEEIELEKKATDQSHY